MRVVAKNPNRPIYLILLAALLVSTFVGAQAQSIEATAPTPISSNDLSGSIAARDIGDSRFTHHYYAFGGNPGDVLITVQSKNLNGDVDVFTAGTLRPLLKFTLYAESSTPITKGIYLRRHEDLILRVEARSPNDDEGIYQIRFGGSFEPIAAPLVAEADKPESTIDLSTSTAKKGRRVTSAGARINEPAPPPEEVAVVVPTPTPSPEATPVERAEPAPVRTTPSRRGRGRTPARRTPAPRPEATTPEIETKPAEVKKAEKVATVEPEPARPARRTGRRGARTPAPIPVEPEPPSGPRLVLEMLDGTRSERFMSTIRRVTIENNQIVVTGKDGKIDRTRMSEVLRMTIEP